MPKIKFPFEGRTTKPDFGELCKHEDPDHIVWCTAEGRYFYLCEMTGMHLIRCYHIVDRVYKAAADEHFGWYPSFNGEMAQYYGEQEWEQEDLELGQIAYVQAMIRKQIYDRGIWVEVPGGIEVHASR